MKQFLVLFNEGTSLGFDQIFYVDPVSGAADDHIFDLGEDGYEVFSLAAVPRLTHCSLTMICRPKMLIPTKRRATTLKTTSFTSVGVFFCRGTTSLKIMYPPLQHPFQQLFSPSCCIRRG